MRFLLRQKDNRAQRFTRDSDDGPAVPEETHEDCKVIEVPEECISYLLGRQGTCFWEDQNKDES